MMKIFNPFDQIAISTANFLFSFNDMGKDNKFKTGPSILKHLLTKKIKEQRNIRPEKYK